MNIKDVLENEGVRLSYGHRWMIFDNMYNEFEVYEHKPYAKKVKMIISTPGASEAIEHLLSD